MAESAILAAWNRSHNFVKFWRRRSRVLINAPYCDCVALQLDNP
jgi:hypothetical protein